MLAQDHESLSLLRGHHLRSVLPETHDILLQRLSGRSVPAIAKALSRSTGSIRREIERVQDAILASVTTDGEPIVEPPLEARSTGNTDGQALKSCKEL